MGRKQKVITWCLLALALVITAAGALTGGGEDVLAKAINICSECIGLG